MNGLMVRYTGMHAFVAFYYYELFLAGRQQIEMIRA
jgi:hypothetical protein